MYCKPTSIRVQGLLISMSSHAIGGPSPSPPSLGAKECSKNLDSATRPHTVEIYCTMDIH